MGEAAAAADAAEAAIAAPGPPKPLFRRRGAGARAGARRAGAATRLDDAPGDGDEGGVGARAGGAAGAGGAGGAKLGFSTRGDKREVGRGADLGRAAFAAGGGAGAGAGASDATRTTRIDADEANDARAQRERQLARAAGGQDIDDATKGVYAGVAGYVDRTAGFRREAQLSGAEQANRGPARAAANVRYHFRMDYQPDVCKDYKQTGYCGYGDACIFLHDRGDYKAGWQLDQEWEEEQKKKREREERIANGEFVEDEEEDDAKRGKGDDLPFGCAICREPFVDPVVTRCKHYFCEHCALKRYANNKTCAVCGKDTGGQFNVAHDILRRRKQLEREAKRARTS